MAVELETPLSAGQNDAERRTADVAVQTSPTAGAAAGRRSACRCGVLLLCLLSVVVAALAVAVAILVKHREAKQVNESVLRRTIGEEGYAMFSSYDRNMDGYLSLAEFEPLLNKMGVDDHVPVDFDSFMAEVDPTLEVITVESHFQPVLLETMTKERSDGLFSKSDKSMACLEDWRSPYRGMAGFGASQFAAFLPKEAVPVGQVYQLVHSNLQAFANTLSSNRYYPPRPLEQEKLLQALLSMFHPRPFLHTRFGPQGVAALVRAENKLYVDVVFRMHAEFQLNEPPDHPFWFTPAQFTGNLVIRRDSSHIERFHLYVPNNKSLNVDMEWMNGPMENENMEVDIGFMPQMELTVSNPSSHISVYDENGKVLQEAKPMVTDLLDGKISWNSQVSMEDAFSILDRHFYRFKSVPYLPMAEAFTRAEAEKKLVHSILLWGSLDDQSC